MKPIRFFLALTALVSPLLASEAEKPAPRDYATVRAPPAPQSQELESAEAKSAGCVSCHTDSDRKTMHPTEAVVQGSMDRGSLAFIELPSSRHLGTNYGEDAPTLFYKPRGGTARRIAGPGGYQLAVHGPWIAQTQDADYTVNCGTTELIDTRRAVSSQRTAIRTIGCGEGGEAAAGNAFVGDNLYFGMSVGPLTATSGTLYRHSLVSGTDFTGPSHVGALEAWAQTSPNSA